MLPGGEDAINVGNLQTGIGDRVVDRLQMQTGQADVGQLADFIGFIDADNGDGVG